MKWFCFVNNIQFGNTQFSASVVHGCHRFGQGFWSQTHWILVKIHLFGFLDFFLCVTHCQMFCAVDVRERGQESSAKTTWCFKSWCLFGFVESCQPEPQGVIKNHRSPQKSMHLTLEDSLFHLLQLRLWMAKKKQWWFLPHNYAQRAINRIFSGYWSLPSGLGTLTDHRCPFPTGWLINTLWFNIAMENHIFLMGKLTTNGHFQ